MHSGVGPALEVPMSTAIRQRIEDNQSPSIDDYLDVIALAPPRDHQLYACPIRLCEETATGHCLLSHLNEQHLRFPSHLCRSCNIHFYSRRTKNLHREGAHRRVWVVVDLDAVPVVQPPPPAPATESALPFQETLSIAMAVLLEILHEHMNKNNT